MSGPEWGGDGTAGPILRKPGYATALRLPLDAGHGITHLGRPWGEDRSFVPQLPYSTQQTLCCYTLQHQVKYLTDTKYSTNIYIIKEMRKTLQQ